MIDTSYDAIIVGAGMSGSMVAKELCDQGIKTLLLERGRDVKHKEDYPTTNLNPWQFEHRGQMPLDVTKANPSIARCYAYREDNAHFFVKDTEHPYVQEKPFDWIRGYQVGGKSLMWARQTQRWSDFDFEGPARDGFAVDWPIRYKDLAPWYDKVERFVGISGEKDGLPELPDGEFLPSWQRNVVEQYFTDVIAKNYQDRHVIYARCAHLSKPNQIHLDQGRGQCLTRTECERGCPFGGYFSANSSTIPWALKTGNLTLRPHSVVESILYDEDQQRATGVRVIDAQTKDVIDYKAKVVFVNAGAINTAMILLNSTSDRFPNGLGNDNGLMGKHVAFHNYRATIRAKHEGHLDKRTIGRIPTSSYVPRFRNVRRQETDFLRGYAAGFIAHRNYDYPDLDGLLGQDRTDAILEWKQTLKPYWSVNSHMMGETIPKETNYVRLDPEKTDEWGVPLVRINVDYDDNDVKMTADYFEQFTEMYERAGFTDIQTHDSNRIPGLDIHEMGGVRMGRDPKTSLLNEWNQLHACKNVVVTDGACMTSTATQNPSLTYMAIAARAADRVVTELKRGEMG